MIQIFGDSFSSNRRGWVNRFGKTFGTNGASEYRIYRTIKQVNPTCPIVVCHTHWSRLFLKDTNRSLLSRSLRSHPFCDILGNDVIEKNEETFLSTLSTIWDEEYLKDSYWLMVNALLSIPDSTHITFFEDITHPKIHNLHGIWQANKGQINHMSKQGNTEVANYLKPYLERYS